MHRNTFSIFLILLAIFAISNWFNMPIYPDEVAMHFSLGRYLQDSSVDTSPYLIKRNILKFFMLKNPKNLTLLFNLRLFN